VQAWYRDHPALIAGYSILVAWVCRQAGQMVGIGERSEHGAALPLHRNLRHWLSLYRQHRRVIADLKSYDHHDPALQGLSAQFDQVIADMQALPIDGDVRHSKAEACGQRMLDLIFAIDALEASPNGQKLDISEPRFLSVWHFIAVNLPCLILYRMPAMRLLLRARHGQEEALEQIMRFDRNVIFDPAISQFIHANPEHWKIVAANLNPRTPCIGTTRWKILGGASMRVMAQECHYRLTYQSIAGLFHAFAQDIDKAPDDYDISKLAARSFEWQISAALRERQALLIAPEHMPAAVNVRKSGGKNISHQSLT
jgi:hypothetical protein